MYLLWPSWSDPVRGLRFAQLMIAALLLVAWLPVARFAEKPIEPAKLAQMVKELLPA